MQNYSLGRKWLKYVLGFHVRMDGDGTLLRMMTNELRNSDLQTVKEYHTLTETSFQVL